MDIKKRAFGLSLALAVGVGLGLNAEAIAAPDAAQTPASQPIVRTLNEEFKLTTTDNGIYCQDAQGKAVLGWQEVDGSVYYFQKGSGYAKCGWAFIDGNWYNFDNDGKLKLGWSTW